MGARQISAARRLRQGRRGDHRLPVPHPARDIGTRYLLFILIGTSLAGALITYLLRIETTGINLEQIGAAATGKHT